MGIEGAIVLRAQGRVGASLRGKYTLSRLIGVGGSAAVYEGRHRNGLRVAVKVLHAELAEDPSFRRRFLREGYIANRIEHPGVVRILDDDEDEDGTAFIALELLEGRTLEDEWRASPTGALSVERVVTVAREVLDVLVAAHAAQVVHRDVKPENVFVTSGGTIKLLDFGIARLVDHPRATPTGDAMGSAEFMSPEQARGRASDVDERSDVYSVGAMMFSLASGRFVHAGANALERTILAATANAPALRSAAPDVDEELAHVVDRALSRKAADRWPTAAAMRNALDAACPPPREGTR